VSSLTIRKRRDDELERVPLASRSGAFYVAKQREDGVVVGGEGEGESGDGTTNDGTIPRIPNGVGGSSSFKKRRELRELASLVTRAGLMNTRIPGAQSVKVRIIVV